MNDEISPEGKLEIEIDNSHRHIGVLIAVMAALLALSENGERNAQTEMLRDTVQASDTWAFFQAKTIRGTILKTHAQDLEAQAIAMPPGPQRQAIEKTIADWRANAARYESEPATGEGRKELSAKARAFEARRDEREAAADKYEIGGSALQIAIVLASSAVVTNQRWLVYGGAGLGVLGALISLTGLLAPQFLAG